MQLTSSARRSVFLFLGLSVTDLVAVTSVHALHPYSKSCLMPALAVVHLAQRGREGARGGGAFVLAALAASWIGDVLLLWPSLFLAGLGAFLVAHLLLLFAYRTHRGERSATQWWAQVASVVAVLSGVALASVLVPRLGAMAPPVLVYAAVLVAMVLSAAARTSFTSIASGALTLVGAMLFFASDSMIAIDKFVSPLPHSGLLVMGTYDLGQLLIVLGLSAHATKVRSAVSVSTEPFG